MKQGEALKKVRTKYENMVYALYDRLDPSGFNTARYKKFFNNLSDKQFIEYAKKCLSQDDFIFSLDIDEMRDDLSLAEIKEIAEENNVKLEEYLIMPYRNTNKDPMVSLTRVPVLYCQIRRFFQQILQHKNSIASKNDKINPLTGQVINEDKTASTTNIQTYGLTVLNQKDTLKELLGPRADDPVSKADMMSQIENSGVYRMNNSIILTENKQAINTAETFAKAAGIDIKFKRNNLSNSQQQFTQEELSEIFSEEIEDEE
jgi:hypothetical protein